MATISREYKVRSAEGKYVEGIRAHLSDEKRRRDNIILIESSIYNEIYHFNKTTVTLKGEPHPANIVGHGWSDKELIKMRESLRKLLKKGYGYVGIVGKSEDVEETRRLLEKIIKFNLEEVSTFEFDQISQDGR